MSASRTTNSTASAGRCASPALPALLAQVDEIAPVLASSARESERLGRLAPVAGGVVAWIKTGRQLPAGLKSLIWPTVGLHEMAR